MPVVKPRVEEHNATSPPIVGASMSSAAFLGETLHGPLAPHWVTSVAEFRHLYGDTAAPGGYLPYAVQGFFENGGTKLCIGRVVARGSRVDAEDYEGHVAHRRTEVSGLAALELEAFGEVALVYAPCPAHHSAEIARAVIRHCERQLRFAVVDVPLDAELVSFEPREQIAASSNASCYGPWLWVEASHSHGRVCVPPGGHVLGVFARTDAEAGVWKSPAGEALLGAVDLRVEVGDTEGGVMTDHGLNPIRRFAERGILVWGARTLTTDAEWKYVSVRRLGLFLERSIYQSTSWVVFEPNAERLWWQVQQTISNFMLQAWEQGAIAGDRADKAFLVACGRSTMTEDDVVNGRLVCLVGFAAVNPAEFILLRLEWRVRAGA